MAAVHKEKIKTIDLGGRRVDLRIRRHPRARRIILRIDSENDGAVVTLPRRTPEREGLELVYSKAFWILRRLDALPPRVPFTDGVEIPFLGVGRRVRHRPDSRGVVWIEGGEIHVAGRPEHLARRLKDWLVGEARRRISERVRSMAAKLEVRPGRVSMRDTRSRWGSCSANGSISFCWRLVMMPESVIDYVVAHEVSHLRFMDHGPKFWKAVGGLTDDAETSRAWLNSHGERLHRYG